MSDNTADPLLALLLETLLQTVPGAGFASPRPELRESVLSATASDYGRHPFPGFRRRFGRLFDLSEADSAQVLSRMSEPAQWEPLKTLLVYHFDPGPAHASAHAGLVRCQPGVPFPVHRHRGAETTLYLAGAVRDEDSGAILLPGDLVTLPAGSVHRLTVLPPRECVFAVLLEDPMPDFDPDFDSAG